MSPIEEMLIAAGATSRRAPTSKHDERREDRSHVRGKKVSQPEITEIRSGGAHERVAVRRGG
jgi:hypothetical protein